MHLINIEGNKCIATQPLNNGFFIYLLGICGGIREIKLLESYVEKKV